VDKQVKNSILKTLLYSDIFDYPLAKDQIWKFLVSKKVSRRFFERALKELRKEAKIVFSKNFYCLFDRQKIITIRLKRQNESAKKINTARKIVKIFTFLPTVKFIGTSGALAVENCDKNDDIDLFVIADEGKLWLTRFIMIILLKIMRKYRSYNSKGVSDKICLNMLITKEALGLPKERQNLYTAHEVAQMLPILDKENTYDKFLRANIWVKKFLPNAIGRIKNQELRIKNKNRSQLFVIRNSLSIFELIAKYIQLWFINKHKTTEIISDKLLAFHPFDYKNKILLFYNERLKKYETT